MTSVNEELRYANLYWRYGAKKVQFDSDLEELVRSAHHRSDDGDGTVGEFHRLMPALMPGVT